MKRLTPLLIAVITHLLFDGCKKNDDGTVTVVPIAPTNLTATAVSTTQVNLSWTDNSTNEAGFKVQRKTSGTNYTDVTNISPDVTTYTDNGLTPNTTYTYRVYAFNAAGNSLSYTNEATVTTSLSANGTVSALNCAGTTNNGTLIAGSTAANVTSIVPYTGGNGGSYAAQSVSSTGVTGLTATLTAGTFSNGAGSLTYTITGTPSASGTASFSLNIGGQTCTLNRAVNGSSSSGSSASCGAANVHNPALTYGSMTDQDGNTYKTIQIGTQTWMAENLKARRYRNGDVIPNVPDGNIWGSLTTGATCWFNNDSATYNCPYGKLYNWYAVADARNVCPTGWHVPSDAEFTTLINFLGGRTTAGGKMKATGTRYWIIPNAAADNSSGWSGLPGGYRNFDGSFTTVGYGGGWWSSTESNTRYAWDRDLSGDNGDANRFNYYKGNGLSVRCLRD